MTIRSISFICLLALCCVALGGEIEDMHRGAARSEPRGPDQSRSHEQVENQGRGITEIGLERTPCYGTCPVYTVIIKNDGTFRYKGVSNTWPIGVHTGTVRKYEFSELAQFIRDSGYIDLQDSYSRAVTDNPTVYTMAVIDGKRKIVSNYANAGPMKLWAIEQLIDKLLVKAQWDGKPPANKTEEKKSR